MNTTLTPSQQQYIDAHKNYGRQVEKLLYVAPDTKNDLWAIFTAIESNWENLKTHENALFSHGNDAVTII